MSASDAFSSVASLSDLVLARPDVTAQDIARACELALAHKVRSLSVTSACIPASYNLLEEHPIKLGCLIGFPWGTMDPDGKRYETEIAIDNGAQEIELVLSLGPLKDGNVRLVRREILDIVEAAEERPVGVTLETSLLTGDEQAQACAIIAETGAAGVTAGTGYSAGRATTEQVRTLRQGLSPNLFVRATAGVEDIAEVDAFLAAGATRLGILEPLARKLFAAARPPR